MGDLEALGLLTSGQSVLWQLEVLLLHRTTSRTEASVDRNTGQARYQIKMKSEAKFQAIELQNCVAEWSWTRPGTVSYENVNLIMACVSNFLCSWVEWTGEFTAYLSFEYAKTSPFISRSMTEPHIQPSGGKCLLLHQCSTKRACDPSISSVAFLNSFKIVVYFIMLQVK